jgi:hypothetical protein
VNKQRHHSRNNGTASLDIMQVPAIFENASNSVRAVEFGTKSENALDRRFIQ